MVVTGIQSLNDDVLSLIVTQLSQRDAAQLMRTSRALKGQARRRVLSSSKVTAPSQILRFYKFLVEEDDGYRLQCLQKLTIYRSNLPINEPAGGYPPLLAHILRQARSLHTLVVSSTEDHLQNNPVIGDAIAGLRNLQELHLYDVAGEAIRLCGRLTCEPRVVHLAARCSAARPSYGVDRAAFCALPMFQSASVVSLCDFALTREDPLSLDTPTKWPATHTLRLKNVDPIALAAVCPNLSHLQIAFCWHADDAHVAYPYDGHYPYSALAQELTTQIRVLDTFVDNEESMLDHTISSTIQGTHPVVLSTQFGYGDTSLWSSIAEVLRQPGSRTRYLDVLMHDEAEKGQQWLDECLPFIQECNLLCIRLRLVDQLGYAISSRDWEDMDARPEDEFEGEDWEELRETAPGVLAKAVPSLQYIAIARGSMVEDDVAPGGCIFGGRSKWWRVLAGGPNDAVVKLKEVDSRAGERLDMHLRSELFSKTLQLGDEWLL